MSQGEYDQAAWDYAKERATKRYPLPDVLPGVAAARSGGLTFIAVSIFVVLQENVGNTIAGSIVCGVATLIAFLDNRRTWTLHAREEIEAHNYYRSQKVDKPL